MMLTENFFHSLSTGVLIYNYWNNSTKFTHPRRSCELLPFHEQHIKNRIDHQPWKDMALNPAKGHAKYRGQMYPGAPGFHPNIKPFFPNGPFTDHDNVKLPEFFPPYPGFYHRQNPGFYSEYNLNTGGYPGYNPFLYPDVPGFEAAMYPGDRMHPRFHTRFHPGYGNNPYPGLAGMKPFGHYRPQAGEMRKNYRRRQIRNY